MKPAIPVANIYYLLCYAWDRLEEKELVDVSLGPNASLAELFARVLVGGVTHLLKRGVDRAYLTTEDEVAGVRGRIQFASSLKYRSFERARAWCAFDDLSTDVLHNRILKTTLRRLACVGELEPALAERLRDLHRRFPEVSEITLRSDLFRRVSLTRNNAFYGFLLDVCELVHHNLLVTEEEGGSTFRDFTRDDKEMASLFERFLLRFYAREQETYRASARELRWKATGDSRSVAHLPKMRTDVVLTSAAATIVIDAKYYRQMLTERFGSRTIRSGHLYQLYAYMTHLSDDPSSKTVGGMLIYPRVGESVRVRASVRGHPFLAATVDLAREWSDIRSALLLLPSELFAS